jgi:hypothetical protein
MSISEIIGCHDSGVRTPRGELIGLGFAPALTPNAGACSGRLSYGMGSCEKHAAPHCALIESLGSMLIGATLKEQTEIVSFGSLVTLI